MESTLEHDTRAAWDRIAPRYDRTNTPTQMWLAREGLRRVGLGRGMRFLDVAAARNGTGPLAGWLNSRHSFRECGAVWNIEDTSEGNMTTATPAESYDGLIFLENTEAARGLN